jgi:hypothetical protein
VQSMRKQGARRIFSYSLKEGSRSQQIHISRMVAASLHKSTHSSSTSHRAAAPEDRDWTKSRADDEDVPRASRCLRANLPPCLAETESAAGSPSQSRSHRYRHLAAKGLSQNNRPPGPQPEGARRRAGICGVAAPCICPPDARAKVDLLFCDRP